MREVIPHSPGQPGPSGSRRQPSWSGVRGYVRRAFPIRSRLRLILRNVFHFRAASLAVIVGMAVATAVLTGALLVGDSVRGSLRALVLERLGPIDYVLVSRQFFPEHLAGRIASDKRFAGRFRSCIPAVSVRGGAGGESGVRTAGVQIMGVADCDWVKVLPGQAIVNGALADALSVSGVGGTVTFSLPTADDVPREAAFAHRSRTEVTTGLRAQIRQIARDRGVLSLFALAGAQRPPLNAWANLKDLQGTINQEGRVNLLMVQGGSQATDGGGDVAVLDEILRSCIGLEDLGLGLSKSADGTEAILTSRSTYLAPGVEQAATAAAAGLMPLRRVSIYLANSVVRKEGEAVLTSGPAVHRSDRLHYCIVAGIDRLDGQALAEDEIALNAWTADRLRAKVGDEIEMTYYQRQANGEMKEVRSPVTFRVVRILPMSGLGADPTLTPAYKGLTDADTIGDWNPPEGVEIDKKLVTEEDEAYWAKHKAAPKLFINLDTARRLWGNVFGDLTSMRVPAADAEEFSRRLRERLDTASLGFSFMPIKARQLEAASGSTDFAGLFIGFSFFLIVAAALLVAMLFRLAIEQRARQFGLLSAIGFAPRAMLRLAFTEGVILSLIGAGLGLALALGYTNLMIAGLRTWWQGAVGMTSLRSHVEPATIVIGFVASVMIAMTAIYWAVRRISRSTAVSLLCGSWSGSTSTSRAGHLSGVVTASRLAGMGFLGAVSLLIVSLVRPSFAQGAFLTAGTLLLVSGLFFVSARLRVTRRGRASRSLTLLALRNAGRNRARSIAAISLIAFASFTLVTVASMVQAPPADTHARDSGTGGYQLILTADVPLLGDLNTRKGREMLGVRDMDSPLLERARFTSLRTWAGQDASCLNLTRPTSPTILGVPRSMMDARPFTPKGSGAWDRFARSAPFKSTNPRISMMADSESATYILKLSPGDALRITDQLGRPRELVLAATLPHTIFQSELLIHEEDFLRLFPTEAGYGTVLVECPGSDVAALQKLLAAELEDYAVTVEPTSQRLARYLEVANTYLSTFQVLGSLGLMLGTIGLGVILVRNLVERRAELALLAALGFRRGARLRLVLFENAFLLVVGLLIGAVAALIAVLPARRMLNFGELSLTLGLTVLLGLVALTVATLLAARRISPADLRAE